MQHRILRKIEPVYTTIKKFHCYRIMPFQVEGVERNGEMENEVVPLSMNSYHLEPQNPFKIDQVDRVVRSVMINNLEDASYDPIESVELCATVALEIRRRVEKLNFERHRIVVVVTIVEKASQSLHASFGYLWDVEKDNYSTFSYEARTFYAYCCVLGVYYE